MKNTTYLACALALAAATWLSTPAGAAPRCYPTQRFEVIAGALVLDTLTNLVWQQQASSTYMPWEEAQTYCPPGFRLPTERELGSIVDFTVAAPGPTINQTAFPNTPAKAFWSSSPSPNLPGSIRCVLFDDGSTSNCEGQLYVRCVR
jgi:hypothetical protein